MIGLIPAKTVEVQRKPRFDQAGTRSLKTELSVCFGLMRTPPPFQNIVILTYICVASRGALGRGQSPKNRHLGRLAPKKTTLKREIEHFLER